MSRTKIGYILGCLLLASVVGGCAVWPTERGGGAAELVPPAVDEVQLSKTRATWSDTLYLRLQAVEAELDRLVAEGGMIHAPAALTLARTLSVRVRRELAGGLEVDAAVDLLRLEEQVARLWESLEEARLKLDTKGKNGRTLEDSSNA